MNTAHLTNLDEIRRMTEAAIEEERTRYEPDPEYRGGWGYPMGHPDR